MKLQTQTAGVDANPTEKGHVPALSVQRRRAPPGSELRSEVNIELNFPPKLGGARSRLYRRRFLQVNTRWKALAEIYTMHSFAPFSNLNFFVKNRQNFFDIELMNIHDVGETESAG